MNTTSCDNVIAHVFDCRVSEITELWKDLILNPQKLSPQFTGVWLCAVCCVNHRAIIFYLLHDVIVCTCLCVSCFAACRPQSVVVSKNVATLCGWSNPGGCRDQTKLLII